MLNAKKRVRKAMREKRAALSREEVERLSLAAQRHVLDSAAWAEASSVALYLAVRNEAETGLLLQKAWEEGKETLLPCTPEGAPGVMCFVPYREGQPLAPNRFGIPEPLLENGAFCGEAEHRIPDLVVTPGVAFGRDGKRLGNGGGYYDRMFARENMRNATRVGFGYGFQMADGLPVLSWDLPVHAVATEEGLLWL